MRRWILSLYKHLCGLCQSANNLGLCDIVRTLEYALRLVFGHLIEICLICHHVHQSAILVREHASVAHIACGRKIGGHLGIKNYKSNRQSLVFLHRWPQLVLFELVAFTKWFCDFQKYAFIRSSIKNLLCKSHLASTILWAVSLECVSVHFSWGLRRAHLPVGQAVMFPLKTVTCGTESTGT